MAHTNHAVTEKFLLLVITEGSKEFVVGEVRSDYTLIHSNQLRATIDRRGQSDQNISIGNLKSCTEMKRVEFGTNRNGRIGMKPPITIRRISP